MNLTQYKSVRPELHKVSLQSQSSQNPPGTSFTHFAYWWTTFSERGREGICHMCGLPESDALTLWPFLSDESQQKIAMMVCGIAVMARNSFDDLKGIINDI